MRRARPAWRAGVASLFRHGALFPHRTACQKPGVEPNEYVKMDAVEGAMWWYRALHALALAALGPPPAGGDCVLDAGCGTGGFLARLREEWPRRAAFGLEYAPAAAARASQKSGLPVAVGTVNAMPFPDTRFTAVVSLDVLCHAAVDEAGALAEMHRVLAPGGRLVLNLPGLEWLRSPHDTHVHNARRYSATLARDTLARAGFTEIRLSYWNSLLLPLMVLQRKVLARRRAHTSDVEPFAPWLDRSLYAVTALERWLLASGLRFPAGGSVMVTAVRP